MTERGGRTARENGRAHWRLALHRETCAGKRYELNHGEDIGEADQRIKRDAAKWQRRVKKRDEEEGCKDTMEQDPVIY